MRGGFVLKLRFESGCNSDKDEEKYYCGSAYEDMGSCFYSNYDEMNKARRMVALSRRNNLTCVEEKG